MTVIELRDKLDALVKAGEGDLPVCSNTFDGWIGEVADEQVNLALGRVGNGDAPAIRMLMVSA